MVVRNDLLRKLYYEIGDIDGQKDHQIQLCKQLFHSM